MKFMRRSRYLVPLAALLVASSSPQVSTMNEHYIPPPQVMEAPLGLQRENMLETEDIPAPIDYPAEGKAERRLVPFRKFVHFPLDDLMPVVRYLGKYHQGDERWESINTVEYQGKEGLRLRDLDTIMEILKEDMEKGWHLPRPDVDIERRNHDIRIDGEIRPSDLDVERGNQSDTKLYLKNIQ